jgi:hypothetical protein
MFRLYRNNVNTLTTVLVQDTTPVMLPIALNQTRVSGGPILKT